MTPTHPVRSLGDTIRNARVDKGLSLRDLAKRLTNSPSYLSDIENDRRVPAEEVLRDIAKVLQLNFDELMALAGRFGESAERYIKKYPAAGMLFRKISTSNLRDEELRELLKRAEQLGKKKESDS